MATSTSTVPSQPTLTFPRPIFAALSPSPFLHAHLAANPEQPLRANGRTPSEFRTPGINTGSLSHANGSAVVRLGNTAVVCGVRAEILRAEDIVNGEVGQITPDSQDNEENFDQEADAQELESLRLLVPNIELSTGSTPLLLPGNAPSNFAQTLLTRLRNLLHSTHLIRARDLRILYTPPTSELQDEEESPETEIKAYWTLYIDTLFISLDGNAFDAAWSCILAALRNTKLPHAYFDEEFEGILCSDDLAQARSLNLRGLPVPSTFCVVSGRELNKDGVLCDPDAFEESVCKETVCVVVDCTDAVKKKGRGVGKGQIKRIEKSGGAVVDSEAMRALVEKARAQWGVWEDLLRTAR